MMDEIKSASSFDSSSSLSKASSDPHIAINESTEELNLNQFDTQAKNEAKKCVKKGLRKPKLAKSVSASAVKILSPGLLSKSNPHHLRELGVKLTQTAGLKNDHGFIDQLLGFRLHNPTAFSHKAFGIERKCIQ